MPLYCEIHTILRHHCHRIMTILSTYYNTIVHHIANFTLWLCYTWNLIHCNLYHKQVKRAFKKSTQQVNVFPEIYSNNMLNYPVGILTYWRHFMDVNNTFALVFIMLNLHGHWTFNIIECMVYWSNGTLNSNQLNSVFHKVATVGKHMKDKWKAIVEEQF